MKLFIEQDVRLKPIHIKGVCELQNIIDFLSQPTMLELLKAIVYMCFGAVIAMLLHDMRIDRMEKKEQEQKHGKHEKA